MKTALKHSTEPHDNHIILGPLPAPRQSLLMEYIYDKHWQLEISAG